MGDVLIPKLKKPVNIPGLEWTSEHKCIGTKIEQCLNWDRSNNKTVAAWKKPLRSRMFVRTCRVTPCLVRSRQLSINCVHLDFMDRDDDPFKTASRFNTPAHFVHKSYIDKIIQRTTNRFESSIMNLKLLFCKQPNLFPWLIQMNRRRKENTCLSNQRLLSADSFGHEQKRLYRTVHYFKRKIVNLKINYCLKPFEAILVSSPFHDNCFRHSHSL